MFALTPGRVTVALWIIWLVSWMLAAGWSSRTVKRPNIGLQAPDRLITALGVVGLFGQFPRYGVPEPRLWELNAAEAWSLTGLVALGIAFAWWARLHLGKLWSGSVTQKEDHRIVDTGPYAIVRHPIYTGLLLSAFATAGLKASLIGFGGAALMTLGFYLKAQLEERFLRGDLGITYDDYRRRVPMLIPFLGV